MSQIACDLDPLFWWESNKQNFPYLYTLATRLLAIPATSAACERLWSVARRIITTSCTRLDPGIVAQLMFLKENGRILHKHSMSIEHRVRILPTVYGFEDEPN